MKKLQQGTVNVLNLFSFLLLHFFNVLGGLKLLNNTTLFTIVKQYHNSFSMAPLIYKI